MHANLSRDELVELARELLESERITATYQEKFQLLTANVSSPAITTLHIMRVRELCGIIASLQKMDTLTRMKAIQRMEQADAARLIDYLIEEMTPERIVDEAFIGEKWV